MCMLQNKTASILPSVCNISIFSFSLSSSYLFRTFYFCVFFLPNFKRIKIFTESWKLSTWKKKCFFNFFRPSKERMWRKLCALTSFPRHALDLDTAAFVLNECLTTAPLTLKTWRKHISQATIKVFFQCLRKIQRQRVVVKFCNANVTFIARFSLKNSVAYHAIHVP